MQRKHKLCPKCGGLMHRQSNSCRKCFIRESNNGSQYVLRGCGYCDKIFRTHECQLKRGQGKYCSRSCARKGSPTRKRKRVETKCFQCGLKFERHSAELKKRKGDKDFCSPKCWYEYNQRENHILWQGGQDERMNPEYYRWRKAVVERDKGFCRLCHSQEKIEVHHIKKFSLYPSERWIIANGISLCERCHKLVTTKEEYYQPFLQFAANLDVVALKI